MQKEYSNTCIVGTVYSLLLYLLFKSEKEINETFFFLGAGIPSNVRNNIHNKKFIDDRISNWKGYKRFIWKIVLKLKKELFWRFIYNTKIYGHDHLVFSPILIGNNHMTVIEDGLGNYNELINNVPKVSTIRRKIIKLYGRLTLEPKYGKSKYVDKIIMTGKLPIIPEIKDKVELVNVKRMWELSTLEKKELITKIFSINFTEIENCRKRNILLLTQPFNDILTDKELIKIYRDILMEYNPENILIKTHPRDTIDYKKFFKEYQVLQSSIPMELLNVFGFNFDTAITISSNAIFSLPDKTHKIILGHECHPVLLEKMGSSSFFRK